MRTGYAGLLQSPLLTVIKRTDDVGQAQLWRTHLKGCCLGLVPGLACIYRDFFAEKKQKKTAVTCFIWVNDLLYQTRRRCSGTANGLLLGLAAALILGL